MAFSERTWPPGHHIAPPLSSPTAPMRTNVSKVDEWNFEVVWWAELYCSIKTWLRKERVARLSSSAEIFQPFRDLQGASFSNKPQNVSTYTLWRDGRNNWSFSKLVLSNMLFHEYFSSVSVAMNYLEDVGAGETTRLDGENFFSPPRYPNVH